MSNGNDPALVFSDATLPAGQPATHVLIIGVGKYAFGKGSNATAVAGDLNQLSSPPLSARALADWFIKSFTSGHKPLGSVALLISETPTTPYVPSRPSGASQKVLPPAMLSSVKEAAGHWAERLAKNSNNMAVFCFCGHGISKGQKAALLLEDFGSPRAAFDGAVDVDILRGTMKNSPAIQQAYFLDCCRTAVDDLYDNEDRIGTRIVSQPFLAKGHNIPAQQFVLFPTLDGEEAFGIKDAVSVYTSSILDALTFAAADYSTGVWRSTTGNILTSVDQLVSLRVPEQFTKRSKPNALDATNFEFNETSELGVARSFVTLSDRAYWTQVELECVDAAGGAASLKKSGKDSGPETFCTFEMEEGQWRFRGSLPQPPPNILEAHRRVRAPVAYVTLEVAP